MAVHDVLVLGAGPAGLALARECAAAGLDTACVAPEPDRAWVQRFGAWADELTDVLRPSIQASWAAPCIWTRQGGEQVLDRRYVKLDTPDLQRRLLEGVRSSGSPLIDGRAESIEHSSTGSVVTLEGGTELVTRLVVDATGPGLFVQRPDRGGVAYQTAYGELIEVDGHPFDLGEMVLMDLRSVPGARPTDPPTFLYAMPLGKNLLFVEETSLISRPAVSQLSLQSRLARRLQRWGIVPRRTLEVERCSIPMTLALPDRGQRVLAFGMAASMVHPATGYSVARTVARAPDVARGIVDALDRRNDLDAASEEAWRAIWPRDHVRCWELYAFGARFLTTLDQDRVESWFDTFFALSVQDWSGFLSANLTSSQLAQVMTRMYASLDTKTRWDLMRAGASRHGAPLLRAALAN